MDYLLDTTTFVAWVRGHRRVTARATREAGHLAVSALTIFDAVIWLTNGPTPTRHLAAYQQLKGRYAVRDVTADIAHRAGICRHQLPNRNPVQYRVQLLLAATAHELKLVLVTRNPTLYASFPSLTVEDWS